MPLVRTTMQPYHELDVSESEYLDLQRQGLIHSPVQVTRTPMTVPVVVKNNKEGSE